MADSGVNGKSIALLGRWVPALAIAVGSGIGENPAIAQLVPDDTLGSESSIVTPLDGFVDRIDGGAVRGGNLFHSFGEFNIDTGRGAFFDNPAVIENILTRVTGGNPSNIFGTLGVLGDANLFLVNPNGIVFGSDARLDVGGSFFASTAGGILFPDGYEFSATNPDAPPLLTVNVPIGLQFGANSGGIVNQSVATNDAGEERGLSVPSGETLGLVGGNVVFDRGGIVSPGSRVELVGLAAPGIVALSPDGSLSVPPDVPRADLLLRNLSGVNVSAEDGGSIAIHSKNLELSSSSFLRAGIVPGMGSPEIQAGDIDIHATGSVNLRQSQISNTVASGGVGNSGDINIQTGSLFLTGASLGNGTFGRGDAGNVNVTASDTISIDGEGSAAISITGPGSEGNGGEVNIQTGSLFLTNGAVLGANTSGRGDAGRVNVTATDTVSFDGSAAVSIAGPGSEGNGGEVNIQTGSLFLTNDAFLNASTVGRGDAGRVNVTATDTISLDGDGSTVSSIAAAGLEGNGGEVNIQTGSLFLTNGASLLASTDGRGDAGRVNVTATDTISLDGGGSTVSSIAEAGSEENGGEINIQTGSLFLTNGAVLDANTLGRGDAGRVNVTATDTVSFDGSAAISIARPGSEGNGGEINIQTGSLFLTNGASLNAGTAGRGDAGRVNVTATDTISLDGDGSAVGSASGPGSEGNGGDVNIQTGSLFLTNGADLIAGTLGRGDAGRVNVTATDTVSFDGSIVGSGAGPGSEGNGGEINIQTESLFLTNDASLIAGTAGGGDAGSIKIETGELHLTDGATITVSSSLLTPDELQEVQELGIEFSEISGNLGNPGSIDITADDVRLENGGLLGALSSTGQGGNIDVRARDIRLRQGIINASGSDNNPTLEGNIAIDAEILVLLDNSQIITSSTDPQGGSNIRFSPINGENGSLVLLQSPDSLINAEGELVIEGELDPDPAEAPDIDTTDVTSLISQGCQDYEGSEFYITGRGGLPPNPRDLLPGSSLVEINWVEFPDKMASTVESVETHNRPSTHPTENPPLIEAQGWIADEAGNIILTAQPYRGIPYPPALRHLECRDGDRFGETEEATGE